MEELLLALAHAHLKRPAEANKHWQAAVAWLERGPRAVQAACLSGLAGRGPIAALAGLAVEMPHPLLNPFDHQTGNELKALRAEVEKVLAGTR